MERVIQLAKDLHKGLYVYKSREDCLQVLAAIAAASPPWWTPACTAFIAELEKVGATSPLPGRSEAPIVVVEGLDGVGKTLITTHAAERVRGTVMCTPPPRFNAVREALRYQDEGLARAYYSGANYIAAEEMAAAASRGGPVIVDRWWCSTCAMALARSHSLSALPPAGNEVYAWPPDMRRPDVGYLVYVSEEVRQARIRARAPEDAEEKMLSSQAALRAVAMEAYRRTQLLEEVEATTYRAAVNKILTSLEGRHLITAPSYFTESELAEVKPF